MAAAASVVRQARRARNLAGESEADIGRPVLGALRTKSEPKRNPKPIGKPQIPQLKPKTILRILTRDCLFSDGPH